MLKTRFKNKLLKTRKKDFKNARRARAEAFFFWFGEAKAKSKREMPAKLSKISQKAKKTGKPYPCTVFKLSSLQKPFRRLQAYQKALPETHLQECQRGFPESILTLNSRMTACFETWKNIGAGSPSIRA